MKIRIFILIITLLPSSLIFAQQPSTFKEYEKEYTTYMFSDPNPIPVFGKTYPYYRYDGYTDQAKQEQWKVVELENEYLRIKIFPQIGGKIWSVFDKIAQKEMFYDNEVVKFRDISLRGPWTSGGIEFNYSVVGHSPSCSFPVDYLVKNNQNGSVSCVIGVLDLLTRTTWSVEINLPKDKGWFTTKSFWHNATSSFQPYYNWVNTGVKAQDDLKFVYPGTYIISHDGTTYDWPIDKERNKDLSIWAENNFIGSKSYHIAGSHAPYFGAYWSTENFGMMQYANRDEKVGRKIFSWALSDQGKIWEELLTDNTGQYVELQSGRLLNQNMVTSSFTPYKQTQFTPYGTDVWTEYWFPYKDTERVDNASLYGVINLEKMKTEIRLTFSPLQRVNDAFRFYDSENNLLHEQKVNLLVAKTYSSNITIKDAERVQRITLDNKEVWTNDSKKLDRPRKAEPNFDWNTAYGNYIRGRDLSGLRLYDQAEVFIKKSLEMDATYIPSLTEMAALYYYRMHYDSAYYCSRKALSIDSYDAKANYEFGRSALKLGKTYDALDGFELAALTLPLRSAAYTELSKIYYTQNNIQMAMEYAEKSLINNSLNIWGLQMLYFCYSDSKLEDKAREAASRIEAIDPLNYFIQFEKSYLGNSNLAKMSFVDNQRSEFPEQVILELAATYYSLGMVDKCKAVLSISPRANAEIRYWIAYLHKDEPQAASYLLEAEDESPALVFPFREESKAVFDWAMGKSDNWIPRYYLAMLYRSRNSTEEALELLTEVKDTPKFSPFYSFRAAFHKSEDLKEKDLKRAVSFSPREWRYTHQLTRFYMDDNRYAEALKTIEPFYNKNKDHFPSGSLYTRALMVNEDYNKAEKVLANTHILPFEGEGGGRLLHQEIKLMLAVQALNKGQVKQAQNKIEESLDWPHSLGLGKPYDEVIDSRMEDWLRAMTFLKRGDKDMAKKELEKVAASTHRKNSTNTLLQALALYNLGKQSEADDCYSAWDKTQNAQNVKHWGEAFYNENKEKEYPFDYVSLTKMVRLISNAKDIRLF